MEVPVAPDGVYSGYPSFGTSSEVVGAITKAAKTARAAGADLVVVHSHLGEEYETSPNDEQVSYAQSLADSRQVDILFGAHPHVPQPAERLSEGVGGKGERPAPGPAHLSGQGRLDHVHHAAETHRTGSEDSQSGRGHHTSRSPPRPAGHGVGLPVTTMSRGL